MEPLEVMQELATCLCAAIEDAKDDGAPGVCWCGVLGGNADPEQMVGEGENGDCGIGFVQMALAYPSDQLGVQTNVLMTQPTGLGFDLRVGILRQVILSEGIPDEAEVLAYTEQQHADMKMIRKVIACCEGVNQHDMILGPYTPHGPTGLVLGGFWTVYCQVT